MLAIHLCHVNSKSIEPNSNYLESVWKRQQLPSPADKENTSVLIGGPTSRTILNGL